MFEYNFGLYHWRTRLRRLLAGLGALVVGVLLVRERDRRPLALVVGVLASAWGARKSVGTLDSLLRPFPWQIDRAKYATLAALLPLSDADRVVEVGCGTGRSLVGLAPSIPGEATVIAVDVYDDRIILGNGPALARRNAARAGIDVRPVRGDAARLPVAPGTVDVVTACRVLHDLPKADAKRALEDARRALGPDGTLGVLELPYPHDEGVDPVTYWRELVADAGFTVTEQATRGRYVALAATPGTDADGE